MATFARKNTQNFEMITCKLAHIFSMIVGSMIDIDSLNKHGFWKTFKFQQIPIPLWFKALSVTLCPGQVFATLTFRGLC